MSEKSALDKIDEIHSLLTALNNKVDLISANVDLLQGKATKKMLADIDISALTASAAPRPTVKAPAPKAKTTKVRVFGKMYSADQKPVLGATVKIINSSNQVIKTTKTNKAGQWLAFLDPGKYSIRYLKENMPPSYRLAVVKPGINELEIL